MPLDGPLEGHHLVGARRAARIGETPLEELVPIWTRITSKIIKYGFAITYQDLEPPKTGIFDGLHIILDPDVDFEMQCFILLHLFGHSVQWVAPSLEQKLADLQHTQDKLRLMETLKAYEFEAARFGLQLLHEAGAVDVA